MRGKLIEVMDERLDELQHDVGPEQKLEIRELQQLLVGLRQAVEDGEE